MRKVLLATTALVAVSVTAAQADISISVVTTSGNTPQMMPAQHWAMMVHVNITATNCSRQRHDIYRKVVFGAYSSTQLLLRNNTGASYIQVDGDFGTIVLGDYDDSAATAMDGALGRNNDIESQKVVSVALTQLFQVSVLTLSTCHQRFQASKLVCQKI